MTSHNPLDSPDSYGVAWIAALPIERAAAEAMLDEEHAPPTGFVRHQTDANVYTWGRVGEHNIVIASLAAGVYGTTSAATTASSLLASLPSIRVGLLVGIGGGIARPDEDCDIRLGDIVVSQPDGTTGGVCQYDLIKAKSGDRRERKGFLRPPPTVLLNALTRIQADHERKDSKIPCFLQQMLEKNPKMGKTSKQSPGYIYQGIDNDRLFKTSSSHVAGPDCRGCHAAGEVQRDPRDTTDPDVHYGTIASGNSLVKDAATRDRIVADVGEDCICFEMEAAGLMNHFPCLVIRGICDYADSHKNDRWQRYASATAAAYAKELLTYVPVAEVHETKRALEVLRMVLSATVLDRLKKGNDRLILSFFFDFSDTTKQTLDGMLRSLAFQLYQGGAGSAGPLDTSFQAHQNGSDQPATKTLEDVVYKMLAVQKKCSVVLDALDESTTGDELLLWMKDVVSRSELGGVQLICTSRPEAKFLRYIPSLIDEENCLALDKESIDIDIRSLARCPHEVAIEEALASLPRNLEETYRRMIQNIPADRQRDAIRLLQFLVHSKRPLKLAEAKEVIATQIEHKPRFDVKRRPFHETYVLGYCPGLVTVVHVTDEELHSDKELHLAHFSVKEYLLKDNQFDIPTASISITKTCLTYLTDINGSFKKIKRDFPMATYAAKLWTDHAALAQASEDIVQATVRFLEKEATFQRWARLCQGDGPWDDGSGPPQASRLYYACFFGLVASARDLISNGAEVNAQGGEYGNALQAASSRGHQEIVKLLLDKGADVNAQGGRYSNALYAASLKDHQEIVKLLLDKGADVNAQGGEYGNALQAASWEGHQKIVKLLLDKGADVNAQGGRYSNALYAASSRGCQEIVKLLLDKGADVNAQGRPYGNALQTASWEGHQEIVKLLLDKGADVNAQGGRYSNALYAASLKDHQEIVKLLLDKGADVNAQDGRYRNALYAASLRGYQEIVKLLLDKGADVNAQGGYRGNALQAASSRGHQEIVKLLLDKGADVNAQGNPNGNALLAASWEGHQEIVKLLLDKGADVNAQGGYHGNALQAASSRGHQEIVKLLLDKGADVNAQGGYHGNALQAASWEGHQEIVKLLLDKGADVNAQGGYHGNALQAASWEGHQEIVKLLLDKGADVNAQGGEYGNALQAASSRGHQEIVKLLLDKGADVNAQGGYHGNALQAALSEGHQEIAILLLDKGADDNAQGGRYGNALYAASSRGHKEVVILLLDKGADVNAQGGYRGNALYAASSRGHKEVVILLLDKGADVNAQGGYRGNALQAASWEGHQEIVKLLLDKGADVNAQGGQYSNALQAASSRCHQEIVKLLLDKGADVNAQGGRYGNALQAASEGGNKEVVTLLLDKGADVNAQGGEHGNALQAASEGGNKEVVTLLLDKGADVNAQGGIYGNALQAALFEGHQEIAILLLDKGADVNAQGGIYSNALQAASLTGHKEPHIKLSVEDDDGIGESVGGINPQDHYEAFLDVLSTVQGSEIRDMTATSALRRLDEEARAVDPSQDDNNAAQRGRHFYTMLQDLQDSPFRGMGLPSREEIDAVLKVQKKEDSSVTAKIQGRQTNLSSAHAGEPHGSPRLPVHGCERSPEGVGPGQMQLELGRYATYVDVALGLTRHWTLNKLRSLTVLLPAAFNLYSFLKVNDGETNRRPKSSEPVLIKSPCKTLSNHITCTGARSAARLQQVWKERQSRARSHPENLFRQRTYQQATRSTHSCLDNHATANPRHHHQSVPNTLTKIVPTRINKEILVKGRGMPADLAKRTPQETIQAVNRVSIKKGAVAARRLPSGDTIAMKIKILLWNTEGIKQTLEVLLEEAKYDLLAVQEPWINKETKSTYCPRGSRYHLVYKLEGRAAIYVSKRFEIRQWDSEATENWCRVWFLEADLGGEGRGFELWSIYNPPGGENVPRALQGRPRPSHPVVLAGDFNLKHPLWDEFGRYDRKSEDLLKLIYYGEECRGKSDHYPTGARGRGRAWAEAQPNPDGWAWKKMDKERVKAESTLLCKAMGLTDPGPNGLLARIRTGKATPRKKGSCGYSSPWWTAEVQQAAREARRAERLAKETRAEYCWEELGERLRDLARITREARTRAWRNNLQDASEAEKPDRIWRLERWARLRSFLPPEPPRLPAFKDSSGRVTAETHDQKASALAERFFPDPPANLTDVEDPSLPRAAGTRASDVSQAVTPTEGHEGNRRSKPPGRRQGKDLLPMGLLSRRRGDRRPRRPYCNLTFQEPLTRSTTPRLLATLREMGYPRWLVLWTKDWLTGREAILLFDGKAAAPTAVRAGVPQGSPLSTVLFILYISSLYKQLKDEHPHLAIAGFADDQPHGGGTSPVRPTESARFLGVWLDRKLNWKAHLAAVEKKMKTQSYALSRIAAKTWGPGLAKAREVYTKCIRSALAYGASSFHIPTDVEGEPVKKGITWGPREDFENRLQRTDLDDGQGGKRTAGGIILTACRKIQQRLRPRSGNRGRPRTVGLQEPTAVEKTASTIARWTGGAADTDSVVEDAWRARWLKERDGRAVIRPADDLDHQRETLFRDETLRRHDGLSKAKSSLLVQIRTGAVGLRDFLFTRGVPEVLTPACQCGEGRETAEHLVVWCLAPPLTRRWERTDIRTRRDFYSVLHGIDPTSARLAGRVLEWLMDSGRLMMFSLARRLELEAAA
ncbi:hypothetical protein CHGG_03312 [Chaetomium globosum CBS 148.51]|uniref:Uncharacterized protein n=1 Tax=Chaetomium globosum (strain ATCC 6205 / CBS 148.51 / DSM 1962 / NBRC 6347 / NRRL 1970) TaxID=306901 RepID=Q2H8Z2_CHAGB|nr:uncharacterized protein CHGG_03312 [Chaetomium globosum CBS 148.51]EAQ91377.1 hypothetical protein CHGG_03312 [Chaetomium globosum CBS 148.51]